METTLTTCKNNSFSRRATARRFHNRAQLCAEEQEVVSTVVHVVFKNLSSFTFPCEARAVGYTAQQTSVHSVHSVVKNLRWICRSQNFPIDGGRGFKGVISIEDVQRRIVRVRERPVIIDAVWQACMESRLSA